MSCGFEFDNPKKFYGEWLEHFGMPCREEYSGCPSCGNNYFETIKCSFCGQSIVGEYIRIDDGQCFCNNCFVKCSTGE